MTRTTAIPDLRQRLSRMLERGRVLSQANETRIRNAVGDLQVVLTAVGDSTELTEAQRGQVDNAAQVLLEAELSHSERRRQLQKAIRATTQRWASLQDVYDTWLVYERWDDTLDDYQLFKVEYTIDDAGAVTLSVEQAVMARMVYEPLPTTTVTVISGPTAATEAAQQHPSGAVRLVEAYTAPLLERAVADDGTFEVKLIAPGWGSSGYYSPALLQRDAPTVFPAGTHMYWNHPTLTESEERPERDLSDLASVLETPGTWNATHPAGPGVYARAKAKQGYAPSIDDLAADIGTSINTPGAFVLGEAEGQSGRIITQLFNDPFTSVDFVTKPGAGGQIVQMFEAARQQLREAAAPAAAPVVAGATTATPMHVQEASIVTKDDETTALREAQQQLQTEVATLREAGYRRDAADVVRERLATNNELPVASKKRITKQFTESTQPLPMKNGTFDADAYTALVEGAVADEMALVEELRGGGQVQDLGGGNGGDKDAVVLEAANRELEGALGLMGLSESQAKSAARGRG